MKFRRYNRIRTELEQCPYLIFSFPRCGRTWMKFLIGHYIEKHFNVPFSKWLHKPRPGIPSISFRHDFMSMTGNIPWPDYFKVQEQNDFVFTKEYKNNHIIYLYRNPLDVLFSYWPYLKSIPYKNFTPQDFRFIIDFAYSKQWGLDIIIKFMNKMLDHYEKNTNKKIQITYEQMKKDNAIWKQLIEFIFKEFDADAFQYAKEQTTFTKMQQKNSKDVPDEIKFYRKGGSNYINELSKNEQNILQNWPGLKELNIRINENET